MALSQARAIAGPKTFRVQPAGHRAARLPSNGAFATMKSKGAYMVEVEVGEDESEDVAVRRYMKLVVQSKVVEKLRARRSLETKIEAYKRRFRERCEERKLERDGIVLHPAYIDLYGVPEPSPFEEYFSSSDPNDPDAFLDDMAGINMGGQDPFFGQLGSLNELSAPGTGSDWGNYISPDPYAQQQPDANGFVTAQPGFQ